VRLAVLAAAGALAACAYPVDRAACAIDSDCGPSGFCVAGGCRSGTRTCPALQPTYSSIDRNLFQVSCGTSGNKAINCHSAEGAATASFLDLSGDAYPRLFNRTAVNPLGDLKDLILAGESMGATLSLSVAAELGSRVNRIVALNTYDYPQGVERANSLATILVKAMRIPGFGLIPSKLENALILSGVLRGGFFDPKKLPKDFVQELIRSGHRPGYARVETAYFRGLKSYCAARQVYSRVKAPVTLVYGDHDWSRPPEREAVARLVPGSRMLTLADTGHFASLEHPDEVARILIDATR